MPKRALPPKKKPPPRASASRRGYDRHWQKSREGFLRKHPLCRHCEEQGRTTAATEVDHIREHRGQSDPLFWDRANWQPLCKPCHSRKTQASRKKFQ